MNRQGVRVLIADDHPPTRLGIRYALQQAGFEVCAEVGDAEEAVLAARSERPAVCLLDINMAGNGITAAERISAEFPETAIIMLTMLREDHHLFQALKAGAIGYLLKDIDPERLPEAVSAALRGEAALPRSLVSRLIDEFQARGRRHLVLPRHQPTALTPREWDVLRALRDGLSTRQIADRLRVSPVTVRTHVSAILRKLRVKDRESAIRLLREG